MPLTRLKSWSWPWQWRQLSATQRYLVTFLAALAWIASVDRVTPPLLINDSAAEILQVRDMPLLPLRAMVFGYEGGNVDLIESAVPYLYKIPLLFFGNDLGVFIWEMRVLFALSAVLFGIFVARRFGPLTTWLGTGLYIVSAYSAYPPILLTRNGASVLFGLSWLLLAENLLEKTSWRNWLGFTLITVGCVLCYSSFKIFISAGFTILAVRWLIRRDGRSFLKLCAAGVAVLGLLWLLTGGTQFEMMRFVLRGTYVKVGFDAELSPLLRTVNFLWRTLLLPVHESRDGFMAEAMHSSFGRGMLSPWLWPFYAGGLLLIFRRQRPPHFLLWSILALICAGGISTGGPSLKTAFVLWPIVLLIAIAGLDFALELARARSASGATTLVAIVLLTTAYTEGRHLRTTVRQTIYSNPEYQGYTLGLELAQRSYDFLVYHVNGADLARLELKSFTTKSWFAESPEAFRLRRNNGVPGRTVIFAAPQNPPFWQGACGNGNAAKTEERVINQLVYRIETYVQEPAQTSTDSP